MCAGEAGSEGPPPVQPGAACQADGGHHEELPEEDGDGQDHEQDPVPEDGPEGERGGAALPESPQGEGMNAPARSIMFIRGG